MKVFYMLIAELLFLVVEMYALCSVVFKSCLNILFCCSDSNCSVGWVVLVGGLVMYVFPTSQELDRRRLGIVVVCACNHVSHVVLVFGTDGVREVMLCWAIGHHRLMDRYWTLDGRCGCGWYVYVLDVHTQLQELYTRVQNIEGYSGFYSGTLDKVWMVLQ
jgi:hypothetical protein